MLNINQQLDNGQPILISTILLLNLMDIFMILSFYVLIILKPLSLLLLIANKWFFFIALSMETALKDGRSKVQLL